MYRPVCVCSEKTLEDPNLSPLANLGALCNQEVRAKAEFKLPAEAWKMCLDMQKEPYSKGWQT